MLINKRIKDLFLIKAGGDLDDMMVEKEKTNLCKFPIYANSAFNDGVYGFTNQYQYSRESITITARGNLGFAFYRNQPFSAIGRLLVLFPKNNSISVKYINYILQLNTVTGNQTAIPQLTAPQTGSTIISIINDKNAQTLISNYLDIQTTRIDAQISLLEKKVTLLDEYKQSLIYETVTKGLNKNVPMKNSGIDWIGDIPEHWEVKKIKNYFKLGMGDTILKEDLEENGRYPIYSATAEDKYFGYLNKVPNLLNIGDLILPARGNSIGHIKIAKEKCGSTQTTIYLKNRFNKIDSLFAKFYMQGNKNELFFFDNTAIPQITVNQINNKIILIPPKAEQIKISNFLKSQTNTIKLKSDLIIRKIELLKEYKQALIYECVTGKFEITEEHMEIEHTIYRHIDTNLIKNSDSTTYTISKETNWEELKLKMQEEMLTKKLNNSISSIDMLNSNQLSKTKI